MFDSMFSFKQVLYLTSLVVSIPKKFKLILLKVSLKKICHLDRDAHLKFSHLPCSNEVQYEKVAIGHVISKRIG
jgi:hypothetical protein